MDSDELNRLLLLGYLVTDDDLWNDSDEDMHGPAAPPERQKRIWVRPWIQRRYSDSSNTMYKLQKEISEVSMVNKPR